MALDALTGMDFDEAAGTMDNEAQRKADAALYVKFYLRPMLDQLLTEGGLIKKDHPRVKEIRERGLELAANEDEGVGKDWRKYLVVEPAGRPIYRDVEFVTIMRPGDRDSVIDRPVTDEERKRFAPRYELWKKNNSDEGIAGTPLSELSFLSGALREELVFYGIRSAEQLLSLPETVAQKFMGIHGLQAKVQRWLDAADEKAEAANDRAMREKDAKLAALEQAVALLQERLAAHGERPATLLDEPDDEPAAPARRKAPKRKAPRGRRAAEA